jgi:hypothetical protein
MILQILTGCISRAVTEACAFSLRISGLGEAAEGPERPFCPLWRKNAGQGRDDLRTVSNEVRRSHRSAAGLEVVCDSPSVDELACSHASSFW